MQSDSRNTGGIRISKYKIQRDDRSSLVMVSEFKHLPIKLHKRFRAFAKLSFHFAIHGQFVRPRHKIIQGGFIFHIHIWQCFKEVRQINKWI